MGIIVCVYFIIGVVLSYYWFEKDYSKDYEEAEKEGMAEKGAVGILLLLMCAFWPVKLTSRLYKKYSKAR